MLAVGYRLRQFMAWSSALTRLRFFYIAMMCGSGLLYYNMMAFVNNDDTSKPSSLLSMSQLFEMAHPLLPTPRNHGLSENMIDKEINTEGCIIPKLNPNDPETVNFIKKPRIPKCPKHNRALVVANTTHVWLNKYNYKHYAVDKEESIRCCYRAFYSLNNNDRVEYEPCVPFSNSFRALDEFMRVECYNSNNSLIDEQYFAFAFKKQIKSKWYEGDIKNSNYSILVLGIDSVSRMNFHRTMPKTLKYLINKGAVELLGYNKVGRATIPNVYALLMGLSVSEVSETCLSENNTFDKCPFIWNSFRRKEYLTAFAEDNGAIGTFHYVDKNGFRSAPTDYYLHPFTKQAENKNFKPYTKPFETFGYCPCKGNQYFFDVLLDYAKSLFYAVYPSKLFAFFWEGTISHEHIYYPSAMDSSYVRLLQILDGHDYLSNTIVFLVSDHGSGFGPFLQLKQGSIEFRLPFLYILAPESFREHYKEAFENLKLNAHKLTTAFDFHTTLEDLADISTVSNSAIKKRSQESFANKRGISLFLPIPSNRTCESAGIEEAWCACHFNLNISMDDEDIHQATDYAVSHINDLVRKKKKCEQLILKKVMRAEMIKDKPDMKVFLVVMQTSPGNGLFEATLIKHMSGRGQHNFTISGSISRLDVYYRQSLCINEYFLKPYCYCRVH